METKLKIINILVNYQSSKEPNQEYWTIRQFNYSLRSYPLSSIYSIYISYKLNEDYNLNLKIEHVNSQDKWDVYNMDKLLFSFTCKDGRDFINVFEQQLNLELEKQHKKPPESFSSPNYEPDITK
jgi:hypothetical protein